MSPSPAAEFGDAPIMRVNWQSSTEPGAKDHHYSTIDFREFNTQPMRLHISNPPTITANHTSTDNDSNPNSCVFKFAPTEFRDGKQCVTLPPPDPSLKRKRKPGPRESNRFILSARKPLPNSDQVHRDIWKHIFSFSDPRFLLEAKCINRDLYDILTHHSAIWRDSRIRHYGSLCPPCPEGLSEQQYVELLVGRGCQRSSCPQRNTTTVNWALCRRICSTCLAQGRTSADKLHATRRHEVARGVPLWTALPQWYAPDSRLRPLNDAGTDWVTWPGVNFFWSADYDALEKEYLSRKEAGFSDDDILVWWQAIKDKTISRMKHLEKVYRWSYTSRMTGEDRPGGVTAVENRVTRKMFFEEQAAKLSPPMSTDELFCMEAFQKALRTANAASQRSWDVLFEKIQPYREAAQKVIQVKTDTEDDDIKMDFMRKFNRLKNRRTGEVSEEQAYVLRLARNEYAKCIDNRVSEHNMVLTCLRNVYDSYQKLSELERPRGMCPDGEIRPYVLSLDDACMIVDRVISEMTKTSGHLRSKTLECFRCPGCDTTTRFKFRQCLNHVYKKHAWTVGDRGDFAWLLKAPAHREEDLPVVTVPWPRCLPVLPAYCEPLKAPRWHPENEMTFIRDEDNFRRTSAFHERQASWKEDRVPSFDEAFEHVLQTTTGLRMEPRQIVALGLRYASDLCKETAMPTIDDFNTMVMGLQEKYPVLRMSARCGRCARGEGRTKRKEPNKIVIPIDRLYNHWRDRHDLDDTSWMSNYMLLPSDEDLLEELQALDEKLKLEKQKIMAFDPTVEEKKRHNPKATMILATKFTMESLNELYPRIPT
jgi:hypothetical protein